MASTMTLRVLTQAGLALEDEAVSVVAPGEPGYLGMLRRHAPLVTTLKPGTLSWQRAGGERQARRVGAGLLEVEHDHVTILTDSVSELSEPESTGSPHG